LRFERKCAVPVIVCSVDEKLTEPLWKLGPVQGTFIKGEPGSDLIRLINDNLSGSHPPGEDWGEGGRLIRRGIEGFDEGLGLKS